MTEELKPTPASEFRRAREEGVLVQMPFTGRLVTMRNVKPSHLLRLGKLPNPLLTLVSKVIYAMHTEEDWETFYSTAEKQEGLHDYAESLRVVCTAALMSPRVVDDPQADDEIHIDDLEEFEKRYIFNLAFLEAEALSRFRAKQAADVEPAQDGEGDAQQAEQLVS